MPDPGQAAIQRILMLRRFPGFDDASLADLAIIADNVLEQRFEAGATVTETGRASALYLVIAGKLASPESGRAWGPHQTFGALEAMARHPVREAVIAEVPSVTLRIDAAIYREVLEDAFGLLSSVRRSLARTLLGMRPRLPATTLVDTPEATSDALLGMVERLIVLRRHLAFGKGRIEALAALAQASEEIRLPAHVALARAGDLAEGAIVILEGSVSGWLDDERFVLGPGQTIGGLETLAEAPFAATVTTLTPIRALRCPAAALFDVLEDHTDFALALVEALAGELVHRDADEPPLVTDDHPHVN